MENVNIHEAKTHLSRLLEHVSRGEEVIICKAGKPIAKMVPFNADSQHKRKPGLLKGKVRIKKSFEEPLPDNIFSAFEGLSE